MGSMMSPEAQKVLELANDIMWHLSETGEDAARMGPDVVNVLDKEGNKFKISIEFVGSIHDSLR